MKDESVVLNARSFLSAFRLPLSALLFGLTHVLSSAKSFQPIVMPL
jgi:hypothetical protein